MTHSFLILGNNITDEGAIKLAHALTKNDTLYQLELTGNMITDRGAIALAQSLLQNHSLQQLDLLCMLF